MKMREKAKSEPPVLAQGMIWKKEEEPQKENRIYTLLLKGLVVYLIVMGAIGCFLSAFGMEYSKAAVHIVLLATALFCAILYYRKLWENIGYLLVLVLLVFLGSGLWLYINSGFYSIANVAAETASDFFGTDAARNYGEQVANRYLAVTVSMCYLGGICCILLNILIARKMRFFLALPLSMILLILPLYLEQEPEGVYVAMLFGGITAASIVRGNGHYKLTGDNTVYEFREKKREISYIYGHSALAETLAAVAALCFLGVGLLSVIYPREQFQAAHPMSVVKKGTMDTAENLSRLGMLGLFNFYPNTGGLTSGTLGGISSVRLDFETDLTLEFTPYQESPVYLKTFTGETYLPYENQWSRRVGADGRAVPEGDDTVYRLKERYESGNAYAARGTMDVTNVAAPMGMYLPYYSENLTETVYPGRTVTYTYYPMFGVETEELPDGAEASPDDAEALSDDMEEMMAEESQSPPLDWQWLEVPEENREVIAAFCEEAGLFYNGDAMATVSQLADYYQENIPYTLRPGLTPYRRDFVNYFLADNRRGYCAHFASAAVLIFRYLGIPARYVEGYALSLADIAERGEFVEDAQYAQYYDGYSPLGETAVMSIDATDANAHAWVEIYDDKQGWIVAEVTPASEETEEGESFWQRLMNFLGGVQDDDAEEEQSDEEDGAGGQTGRLSAVALRILAGAIVLALLCRWLWGKGRYLYRYYRAGWSGKLLMRYQSYIRRTAKKQKGLTDMVNYEEQVFWLREHGIWEVDGAQARECIGILERAGFSYADIEEREFERVVRYLG
ncbi:MAG: transglutaminase domain-containing protein [Blautia sp.]|nr:transglutaminase domain-containing protein [Blautia sp.]